MKINVDKMNVKSSIATRSNIPVKLEACQPFKSMILEAKDELSLALKAKPPFPKLRAFSVTAMFLSILGYADEIDIILKQLSTTTR